MKDIKGYENEYAITSCGRVWSYKSKKFLSSNDNGRGYKSTGAYKQVINIETGEIFETRAAAARKYNVSKTAINNAIKRKGICCGYHWRDVE